MRSGGGGSGASSTQAPPAAQPAVRVIATGLQVPWGVAFLPGGDALVGERTTGRILRIPAAGGRAQPVMQVPGVDTNAGEGGLLGLAVSPRYAATRWVYAYFTTARDNRIVRFRLGGAPHPDPHRPASAAEIHDGGRIAFGPDGKLYAGRRRRRQRPARRTARALNGKILRLQPDGSVPADNPFRGSPVWSLGHRNVQGLAWDAAGRLWAVEFGQDRFDEVNLIRPGATTGGRVVEGRGGTDGGRYTNPLVTWPTTEASPSGAAIVGGTLYVGALRGERLWRVRLGGARAGSRGPARRALRAAAHGRARARRRAVGDDAQPRRPRLPRPRRRPDRPRRGARRALGSTHVRHRLAPEGPPARSARPRRAALRRGPAHRRDRAAVRAGPRAARTSRSGTRRARCHARARAGDRRARPARDAPRAATAAPGASATSYGLACLELEAGDCGLRSFVSVQGSLAMFPIWKFGSRGAEGASGCRGWPPARRSAASA